MNQLFKSSLRTHLGLVLATTGLLINACSGSDDSGGNGSGGSGTGAADSSGGTVATGGSGTGASGTLDRSALAANCNGMTAEEGAACDEAELVCQDDSGVSCICGGVPAETGDVSGNVGNGFGPGFGMGPTPNQPPPPAEDLYWECFQVGVSSMGGEGGLGGGSFEPGGMGGG